MAWLEIEWTSKMEHSYYFWRVLYLGWLISSDYTTVYLTTFYHAHLRWILFLIIFYGFQPLIILAKRLCLSPDIVLDVSLIIILTLLMLLLSLFVFIVVG